MLAKRISGSQRIGGREFETQKIKTKNKYESKMFQSGLGAPARSFELSPNNHRHIRAQLSEPAGPHSQNGISGRARREPFMRLWRECIAGNSAATERLAAASVLRDRAQPEHH